MLKTNPKRVDTHPFAQKIFVYIFGKRYYNTVMVLDNGNNIIEDIVQLFTQMDSLSWVLLISGTVLCAIYLLMPKFKVFFVSGLFILTAGVCTRMAASGSLQMLFVLVFSISLLLVLMFFSGIGLRKYVWLYRQAENLSESNDSPMDKEFFFLLNHEGVAATNLNPSGIIIINDIKFEAFSGNGEVIEAYTPIRVTEVENEKIKVKPV